MFNSFINRVKEAFKASEITDDFYDELEEAFVLSDVSVKTTNKIIDRLRAEIEVYGIKSTERAYGFLKGLLVDILSYKPEQQNSAASINCKNPYVILVVGVNGVGKTTTIAKIGNLLKKEEKSVILVAGDTFRAAAVEQLQTWGNRIDVSVIAHQMGADPAAVVFDGIKSAQAKNTDFLIVDTAGRLHNKHNLMEELKKINRVIQREIGREANEILLVLDATTGQNALSQAYEFKEAIGVTGLVITKLDGTAKGGNIVSIAAEIPVELKYIGTGEGVDDLSYFNASSFAETLLPNNL